jgi:hypothetical protein
MTKNVYWLVSLLYGVWLDIATATFAGMGEGRMVAGTALFGSPLSLPGLPGWPMWLLFGYLVGQKQRRAAAGVLLVHYASAPFAISHHLDGSLNSDWQQLRELFSSHPFWCYVTFGSYFLGQAAAWTALVHLISSKRRPRS